MGTSSEARAFFRNDTRASRMVWCSLWKSNFLRFDLAPHVGEPYVIELYLVDPRLLERLRDRDVVVPHELAEAVDPLLRALVKREPARVLHRVFPFLEIDTACRP